ncbi:hypothetical protein ABZ319_18850 [Nocardia sp. NPDC005978]|uniref:hypothetical protein n=1 Tax=Nocardia sp. NPDC005978 TaxID=3156725 RepID=UPI0033A60C10
MNNDAKVLEALVLSEPPDDLFTTAELQEKTGLSKDEVRLAAGGGLQSWGFATAIVRHEQETLWKATYRGRREVAANGYKRIGTGPNWGTYWHREGGVNDALDQRTRP